MKRLLPVVLLLVTSPVLAQEVQTVPPGEDKIVSLKLNQPAPFEGQLFEPNTALRWANWLRQYKLVLQIDREYEQKVCKANTNYLERSLELERQKYTTVTEDYQKREADLRAVNMELQLRETPWYQSVWFGVTVGVVATGAAVGLGVYASK